MFRIAALLFVLFAAGHTFGFLSFRPPNSEGLAVLEAMNRVHFQVGGSNFSYGGFYLGFGLSITLNMLLSAFLAWHLWVLVQRSPEAIGALDWVFCGVQVVGLILSPVYFAVVPALLSGIVAVCLAWLCGPGRRGFSLIPSNVKRSTFRVARVPGIRRR